MHQLNEDGWYKDVKEDQNRPAQTIKLFEEIDLRQFGARQRLDSRESRQKPSIRCIQFYPQSKYSIVKLLLKIHQISWVGQVLAWKWRSLRLKKTPNSRRIPGLVQRRMATEATKGADFWRTGEVHESFSVKPSWIFFWGGATVIFGSEEWSTLSERGQRRDETTMAVASVEMLMIGKEQQTQASVDIYRSVLIRWRRYQGTRVGKHHVHVSHFVDFGETLVLINFFQRAHYLN